jgi:hypothetical protein
MKKIITSIAALLVAPNAYGAVYNYHPNSTIYLGGGYNPFQPTQAFQECLEWDSIKSIDSDTGKTAIDTTAIIQTVKSKSDFYSLIDFSSQIQGGYGFFSGEGSVNLVDEYAFHDDSMTWIVLFKTDYGRFRIQNERLKARYNSETPEDLVRKCGSEVATTQRLGVLAYAVLTVKNLSQSKRREFEAKLNVSASGGLWNVDMQNEYKSVLKSSMAATDFSVRLRAIGGAGVVDLSGLLGSSNDQDPFVKYEQIPDVLSHYIKGLTVEGAAPLSYITTDLSAYQSDIPGDRSTFKSVQFEKIFASELTKKSFHG